MTIDYHRNFAFYYWLDDVIAVVRYKINNFKSCLHMITYVFFLYLCIICYNSCLLNNNLTDE